MKGTGMKKRKAKANDMLRTVRAKAQRFVDRRNWAEARPLLQQAATLYEQLEKEAGDVASFAIERAEALHSLARALEDASDVPGAIVQVKRAVAVLKGVTNGDILRRNECLGEALTDLGRWQDERGRHKTAVGTLLEAVAFYREMPNTSACEAKLELALEALAIVHAKRGDVKESDRFFDEAQDLREGLALSDPDKYIGRMASLLRYALAVDVKFGAHEHAVECASRLAAILEGYDEDYVGRDEAMGELRKYVMGPKLRSAIKARAELGESVPWGILESRDWIDLILTDSVYDAFCEWEILDASDWERILTGRPELLVHLDAEVASEWSGRIWSRMLRKFPELSKLCDWSKLDGYSWTHLLSEQPAFADKCDWANQQGIIWGILLMRRPEFAEKCPWEKLDTAAMGLILRAHPEFIDRCDLRRLRGSEWVDLLLARGKTFTPKCDWRKLTKSDWKRLLSRRPGLADMRRFGRYKGPGTKHLKGKRIPLVDAKGHPTDPSHYMIERPGTAGCLISKELFDEIFHKKR